MKNKVLVVAVHPDDETLGCGGTLLKHKAHGDEVYWLLLTGTPINMPEEQMDEAVRFRKTLIQTISESYHFDGVEYLALPPARMHTLDMKEVIGKISEVFNRIHPNIIYTMFANDVHSDHRIAFDAVYSCTKSFRYPFIEHIYMMETLSETEFALSVPEKTFIPNVYVDITDFIKEKLAIMGKYPKQIMEAPYPRSLSSIEALARVRGSRAGVMYAESFQLLFEKK